MAQTQKALILHSFDEAHPAKSLRLVADLPMPEPKDGEVLVRVLVRPINPTDIIGLQGHHAQLHDLIPTVPGSEGVGIVESTGSKKFPKGIRVVGLPFPRSKKNGGTWQQYTTVSENDLVLPNATVPDQLSDEVASQVWVNPLTVRGFFDTLKIPKGEYLLQSAAGSVLGRQVIQFAKHYGIKTINLVRRKEQKEELLDLGGEEVIVSTGSSGEYIGERVKSITGGKGAYAAVDAVGGQLTGQLLKAVRPKGTLAIYGILSGFKFEGNITDVLFHLKVLTGFNLNNWKSDIGKESFLEKVGEVLDLLAQGIVTPYGGKSYQLEQFQEAIEEATRSARGGKVFLKG